MSVTVELPGGTATLLGPDELTNRDVKLLQRSARVAATAAVKMREAGYVEGQPETWASAMYALNDDELDQIDLYQRTCVIKRLESWTLTLPDGTPRPIPASPDEVDDLPRPIFEPITTAAADIELGENFGLEGAADPKADTESSDS